MRKLRTIFHLISGVLLVLSPLAVALSDSSTSQESPKSILTERLLQDEFGDMSPFQEITSSETIKGILDKGVKRFDRQAYRSSQFVWGEGYDVVRYEIYHDDETKSFVLAYRDSSSRQAPKVGMEKDLRDIRVLVYETEDADKMSVTRFTNGQLVVKTTGLKQEMIKTEMSHMLQNSTSLTIGSM